MEGLKKCPFCGSNAVGRCLSNVQLFEIECSKCSRAQTLEGTKERAIKSWNERDGELISKEDVIKAVENSILLSISDGIVPTNQECIDMLIRQLEIK